MFRATISQGSELIDSALGLEDPAAFTLLFKRQTESRSHQSRASEILMMRRMT